MNPSLAKGKGICNQLGLAELRGKYKAQSLDELKPLGPFSAPLCMLALYE